MRIPPALLRRELVCVIVCALAGISYPSSVLVLVVTAMRWED
jgi:hypothetical protein